MNGYKPGDIVPQSSSLYRVVHDPPGKGEQLKTFTVMNVFHPVQNVGRRCVTCFPADFSEIKAETDPLPETPVAGDESWHIETVAKRANKKALEQVEKATDSEPVKGKELLESDELKRQLSKAEERYRSGLSPKKAKSESH
jgi:hypothetical protein